ncbi:MAG TPA: methyltransferase [Candidatus Pullichristensenella avicola]|nr:methyltransferase [Candidatus Pullichristensenella avicola]
MCLQVEFGGQTMAFETAPGLFSPARADRGTLAMLGVAALQPGLRVLDLGCGWGLAGVYAALVCGAQNVVMTDVDPLAAETARRNAVRNGVGEARVYVGDALQAVPDAAFDRILLNPPYQSDFSVAKKLILKSFNRLEMGGKLFLVVKRRDWYFNKLKSVFGGARAHMRDGYFVFEAERRSRSYAQT